MGFKFTLVNYQEQSYEMEGTLSSLAKAVGVTKESLCMVMRGLARPGLDTAFALSEQLGVHELFFFAPKYYDMQGNKLPKEFLDVQRTIKYKRK